MSVGLLAAIITLGYSFEGLDAIRHIMNENNRDSLKTLTAGMVDADIFHLHHRCPAQ